MLTLQRCAGFQRRTKGWSTRYQLQAYTEDDVIPNYSAKPRKLYTVSVERRLESLDSPKRTMCSETAMFIMFLSDIALIASQDISCTVVDDISTDMEITETAEYMLCC